MTQTESEKLDGVFEYLYNVSMMENGEAVEKGWIQARHKEMPFKPECFGIFGMRQVVVFGLSYEVLG